MKLLYLFLCVSYVTCFYIDIKQASKDKVVGNYTQIHKIPYQAALEYKAYLLCGAAIISANWMSLAAQCLIAYNDITAHGRFRIGTSFTESRGQTVRIADIIIHESFDNITLDNDIGLSQLAESIPFSKNVKPIRLAKPYEFPKPGDDILISGFGSKELIYPDKTTSISYVLTSTKIKVLEYSICDEYNTNFPLTDNMFCVQSGASDGDAGGPGVINGKLAGIISTAGIGTKPSVYTKVSKYHNWIVERTDIKELYKSSSRS